ncbi:protein MEI2-like 6 [Impatiens glandulifera]|uniref:protein MEI2-like 6 n=1 Tax=Impatiens glandulifera TaxID=253017 RepID=UPI001FB154BA|nr:protein MEI2-like 6 [Impatiens glandulifera]
MTTSKPLSSEAKAYVPSAVWFRNVCYFPPPLFPAPTNYFRQYFVTQPLPYYRPNPLSKVSLSSSVKPRKETTQFVQFGRRTFIPPRLQRSNRPKQFLWLPKRNQNSSPKSKPEKISSVPPSPPPPSDQTNVTTTKTTLMIRNIPNQIRRHEFVDYLNKQISQQQKNSDSVQIQFDFLYLPMDFRKHNNLGYAFVNFTSEAAAGRVREMLDNFKWETYYRSVKVCKIDWGRIQGKDALVRRFVNTDFHCQNSEYLPIVFNPASGSEYTTVGRCVFGARACDGARVRV